MLIIRVGYVDTAEARVHADAIAAVLQAMPVTRQLDGTVVIGCGGATGIADATRPVVAVPMAWLLAPDALTRVRIGRVLLGELPVGKWRLLGPDESFA